MALLVDLRALAEREQRLADFAGRSAELRRHHARKPSLMERFDRANIPATN